jgi:hypothetical protein
MAVMMATGSWGKHISDDINREANDCRNDFIKKNAGLSL